MMNRATIVLVHFLVDQCLIGLINITSYWGILHSVRATIHPWSHSSVASCVRTTSISSKVCLLSFPLQKTDYYDKTYRYQNTYRGAVQQSMTNLIECQSKYRLSQNPNYPGWEKTSCCHQHRCNHERIHLALGSFAFPCPICIYLQTRAWLNSSKSTSLFYVSRWLESFQLVSNAFVFGNEP
jgi:hypothetical protein